MVRPKHILFFLIMFILPERSEPGVVITKAGTSWEDCAEECDKVGEIECRYYKFLEKKLSCLLSASSDPSISGMKMIDKPSPGPVSKPASTWLAQIQARILALEQRNIDVKNMHEKINDLKAEVIGLKNSRGMTHHLLRTIKEQQDKNVAAIDDKAEALRSEIKRVEDAVMTLGDIQKTFGERIRKVNEGEKSTSLTVAMLSQTEKDMRTSIRELVTMTTDVRTQLSNLKKITTELEVRFAGLSTDVMEKVAGIDSLIGPELKEEKESQMTLAQALSMLTKKIMTLTPRIPILQREIGKSQGQMSMVLKKVEDFHNTIELFNKKLDFTEDQLKKFVDPASQINMDRRRLITQLRSEVAVLSQRQRRVQNDVLVEIADRTRLYKELEELKVYKHEMKEHLDEIGQELKAFRAVIRELAFRGPRGKLVSNIINRQVAVLKRLKKIHEMQNMVTASLRDYKRKLAQTKGRFVYSLKTRQEEMDQLRKLQGKLMEIYKTLDIPAWNKRSQLVNKMFKEQEATRERIAQLTLLQLALRRDFHVYRNAIMDSRQKLAKQWQEQQGSLMELRRLKERTNRLFNLLMKRLEESRELKRQGKEGGGDIEDILNGFAGDMKKPDNKGGPGGPGPGGPGGLGGPNEAKGGPPPNGPAGFPNLDMPTSMVQTIGQPGLSGPFDGQSTKSLQSQMAQVMDAQRAVADIMQNYRSALSNTQLRLLNQKKAQETESQHSQLLQQALNEIQKNQIDAVRKWHDHAESLKDYSLRRMNDIEKQNKDNMNSLNLYNMSSFNPPGSSPNGRLMLEGMDDSDMYQGLINRMNSPPPRPPDDAIAPDPKIDRGVENEAEEEEAFNPELVRNFLDVLRAV